jgi:hypothetical protein
MIAKARGAAGSAPALALALAVAVAATPRAAADSQSLPAASPSRVIDRTMVCRLAFGSVDVVASPRGAPNISGLAFAPSSGFALLNAGVRSDPLSDLVVAARPGVRSGNYRFPAAVYASSRRCVASRAAVPLARAGLPGPPTEFLSEGDCTADGRVLVRVRAVLAAPATWSRFDGAFIGARGRLVEADLAIRDQRTRSPLAFARVRRTGKTQVWTGTRCT